MSTLTKQPTVRAELPDGTTVELRPIQPEDKDLMLEGFERLSPRGRFMRFMAPTSRLTPTQLKYFSELDFHDHVAWGVTSGADPVAVGRFVRYEHDETAADVAVAVVDDFQRRGIGKLMCQVLAASARARGIGLLHFDVLAENTAMLGLLESLGGVRVSGGEIVHLVLDVAKVGAPPIVEGDLLALLEEATQRAAGR